MSGWTKKGLDEKAKRDAENKNYDPPWGWFPGREPVGRPDRDTYDKAYEYHKDQSGKKR